MLLSSGFSARAQVDDQGRSWPLTEMLARLSSSAAHRSPSKVEDHSRRRPAKTAVEDAFMSCLDTVAYEKPAPSVEEE